MTLRNSSVLQMSGTLRRKHVLPCRFSLLCISSACLQCWQVGRNFSEPAATYYYFCTPAGTGCSRLLESFSRVRKERTSDEKYATRNETIAASAGGDKNFSRHSEHSLPATQACKGKQHILRSSSDDATRGELLRNKEAKL
ncbi:hypothetical protein MTO96_039568 [Rhipicephalus appendiculatus]